MIDYYVSVDKNTVDIYLGFLEKHLNLCPLRANLPKNISFQKMYTF